MDKKGKPLEDIKDIWPILYGLKLRSILVVKTTTRILKFFIFDCVTHDLIRVRQMETTRGRHRKKPTWNPRDQYNLKSFQYPPTLGTRREAEWARHIHSNLKEDI